MTSDNLLKFLGNREYLHQVSYQELKSMVVQYPYSLSLRYLLAMKSQQEDNTDLDRNIELLSTYGIDRAHLHRIFSEDPIVLEDLEESIIMGEDFLELKELSALERGLEEKLVVNEVNDLNFLPEENQLAAKEIPLPNPSMNLPTPPPVRVPIVNEAVGNADITVPSLEKEVTIDALPSNIVETSEIETPGLASSPNQEIIVTDNEKIIRPEVSDELDKIEESSTLEKETNIEINTSNIVETGKIETPTTTLESNQQDILIEKEAILIAEESHELEEEEFITLDFEDAVIAEMSEKIENEEAPSAALITNEVLIDGLPTDAIDINDLSYAVTDKPIVDDALVKELFEEAEAEAIAEPAISDSTTFIENPAEILVTASELIESEAKEEVNLAATDLLANETIETPPLIPTPPIPFEIEFSEADPVTITSIQEGTEVILPEEEEEEEEAIEAASSKEVSEIPETAIISSEDTLKENLESIAEVIPIVSEELTKDDLPTQEVIAQKPSETEKVNTVEALDKEKEIVAIPAKVAFKFNSLDRLEASFNQPTKVIKPAPKVKFNSWQETYAGVRQFSGTNLVPLRDGVGKTIKRKRKATRKKFAKTVAFAEESLTTDNALVSETLAQLLVKQGQYSRARKMYDQLCLIIPEKSGFFAGEIEKIQNLPDEDS